MKKNIKLSGILIVFIMILSIIPLSLPKAQASGDITEDTVLITSLNITVENYDKDHTVGDLVITDDNSHTMHEQYDVASLISDGLIRREEGTSWVAVTDATEKIDGTKKYRISLKLFEAGMGVKLAPFFTDGVTITGAELESAETYGVTGNDCYLAIVLGAPALYDKLEFSARGVEVGREIAKTQVRSVGGLVEVGTEYLTDFVVFDQLGGTPYINGSYQANTLYDIAINFRLKENTGLTFNEVRIDRITLNGIASHAINYNSEEDFYVAFFLLPLEISEGTSIESVAINLGGYAYGNTLADLTLQIDESNPQYEIVIGNIITLDGEGIAGSNAISDEDYTLMVALSGKEGSHLLKLTPEDASVNGIKARAIAHSYITADTLVSVLFFDLPRLIDGEIDTVVLRMGSAEEGGRIEIPTLYQVNNSFDEERLELVEIKSANWMFFETFSGEPPVALDTTDESVVFEMGNMYLLNLEMSSEYVKFSQLGCDVYILDNNGNEIFFFKDSLVNEETGTLLVSGEFDKLAYEPVQSIEITTTKSVIPKTGESILQDESEFVVTKVNGSEEMVSMVMELSSSWYFTDLINAGSERRKRCDFEEFRSGYYYSLELQIELEEKCSFAESVQITLATPDGNFTNSAEVEFESLAQSIIAFEEKTQGETLKKYGETEIVISGYEVGATLSDISVEVNGEGFLPLENFTIFNITQSEGFYEGDIIEFGSVYDIEFDLLPQDGYTVVDFELLYSDVKIKVGNNSYTGFIEYNYDPTGEWINCCYVLPILIQNAEELTPPQMSLDNFVIGGKLSDVALNITSECLTEATEYFAIFDINNMEGNVIEAHKQYILFIRLWINEGYAIDDINNEAFKLDNTLPFMIIFDVKNDTLKPYVELVYKTPILHDYNSDWKSDGENHWIECSCGAIDSESIEAHDDTDSNGKCDMCGYDMPAGGGEGGSSSGGESANTGESAGSGGSSGGKSGCKSNIFQTEGKGLSSLAIAGIVVGGLAIIWFIKKRKV